MFERYNRSFSHNTNKISNSRYWFEIERKKFLKESGKKKSRHLKVKSSLIEVKFGYNLHSWY